MADRSSRLEPNVNELYDDFRDLLVSLDVAGAEFVVVGGYAVAFHGHPRATKDLDVFVRASTDNARCVIAALAAFGAPLEQLGIKEADFEVAGMVVQLGVPPVRIDLLTEISGVSFDDAITGAPTMDVGGCAIRLLSRENLLRNKRASARLQDLADVEALERITR